MNRTVLLCTGIALLGVTGCVISIDADDHGYESHHSGSGLERLYAAEFTDEGLRVRVESNGCTSEDSFDVRVHEDGDDYEVRLRRKNKDRCESYDENGVELIYSWTELGLPDDAEVEILNPVGR